jgi:hypothetical protein
MKKEIENSIGNLFAKIREKPLQAVTNSKIKAI